MGPGLPMRVELCVSHPRGGERARGWTCVPSEQPKALGRWAMSLARCGVRIKLVSVLEPSTRGCTPSVLGTWCDLGRWEPARHHGFRLVPLCRGAPRPPEPPCQTVRSDPAPAIEARGSRGWMREHGVAVPPAVLPCQRGGPSLTCPRGDRSSLGAALGRHSVSVGSSIQPGYGLAPPSPYAGPGTCPAAHAPAAGPGSLGKSHCSTFSSSSVKQMQLSPVAGRVDCRYLFEALSSSEGRLLGPAGRGAGV